MRRITNVLHFTPPIRGTVLAEGWDSNLPGTPCICTDEAGNRFIGLQQQGGDGAVVYLADISDRIAENDLKVIGTRALHLISAIMAKGSPMTDQLARECWFASFLSLPTHGANRATSDRARNIVYSHLGEDVAAYLRQLEACRV